MPGPPPKRTRTRRNDAKKDFRSLPAGGRSGATPPWPLQPDLSMSVRLEFQRDQVVSLQLELDRAEDGRARGRLRRQIAKFELSNAELALQIEQSTDMETALWRELWSTPQAVIWEESHAEREVAQYVRWKIRAEQGDLKASTEARMLSDRLGLSPLALLRLRAEIEKVDEAENRGTRRRGAARPAAEDDKPDEGDGDPRGGLFAVS